MVTNIQINQPGRGCGPCQMNAYVSLNGGGATTGANGRPVHPMGLAAYLYAWHVDSPTEVARLVKAVKAKFFGEANVLTGTVHNPAFISQPTATPGPSHVRVFVTHAAHPDAAAQIVMVDNTGSDMAGVLKAVAAKLNVPYSSDLGLQLAGVGSPITSPQEISANDKLVLTGGSAPPAYAH
jgi:hypothetical protein